MTNTHSTDESTMTGRKIILDCDLMRYRHSGLYHYCLNLGNYVNRRLQAENKDLLSFYVPKEERNSFEHRARCIIEKRWHHRFFKPFLWNCAVWHAPFQSGRIIPMPDKKIKVLLTIHDLNCLHEDKSAKERRQSLLHTQKLVERADAIVCISNHCRKDVTDHLETGGKTIHVIHNGTHHVHTPPARPVAYLPARPFVFTMGYVNRKKNFHTLIPLLKDESIELVVAGRLDEPDYITGMKETAAALGVADRLQILGPVSEEDKAWYLQHCLAFTLPSLAEGFGAPVVEAMAFGKPLFLAHRTSLPEIGQEVAFYFRNFDPAHMQQVFKQGMQEYQRNGLAAKIIQRGNEFTWEEKAADYCRVYETLL
ncbi:MAG: glycosyltransferase family 4 protein [Chitinophagaceae bacterium]|nr:glycosyltransferase family 4 protein [Chitinophagaceae bacterium]